MTDVRFVDLVEQPTAVVRDRVRMTELTSFFGAAFDAVAGTLAARGAAPAGPPFAYYHGMPTEWVDVEAGFPVRTPIEPSGTVVPSVLPAGHAAEATHVGPYDTLGDTYDDVLGAVRAGGHQPASGMWEYYLSDPAAEPDPATWRTTVVWPVS
ncbi:GyrI-like domain-containing protein [Kineosporia sp. A_224]|uniref:GyrI-like domain-containing protein n=1 Tax=Kineosporia sp. A_224 TaxID=1962180 RepID=UPI000B4BD79A|nr:GyrI-like domain-containing protein [Kineosporia sp. A_224]